MAEVHMSDPPGADAAPAPAHAAAPPPGAAAASQLGGAHAPIATPPGSAVGGPTASPAPLAGPAAPPPALQAPLLPIYSAPANTFGINTPVFAPGSDDPTLYLVRLEAWAEITRFPIREPLKLYALLMSANPGNTVSQWAHDASAAGVQIRNFDVLTRSFVERFANQVRSAPSEARDKLFNRQLRMPAQGGKLVDYMGEFRGAMLHCPDMAESDRLRWFHSGLTPALRTACAVDYSGQDFTSLSQLMQHALGEERKMVFASRESGTRVTSASRQTDTNRPPRFSSVSPQKRSAPSAPSATSERPAQRQRNNRTAAAPSASASLPRADFPAAAPAPPLTGRNNPDSAKSRLRHFLPPHRHLTLKEADQLRNGGCYNCCVRRAGHLASQCPHGRKPVADDPQPPRA